MASVMAALKTHDCLCVIGKPVNDLAFSFVAPLGANHNDVFCGAFL
jgi:hypothetical protein